VALELATLTGGAALFGTGLALIDTRRTRLRTMRWLGSFACTVALVACTKQDTGRTDVTPGNHRVVSPTTVAGDAAAKPVVDASSRAREMLERQIEALKKSEENDPGLLATFDPDAVLLVPDARLVNDPTLGFRDAITQRAPHETVTQVSFSDLVAGGNDSAVWFTAILAVKQDSATYAIRVTELATADAGWKIAAAAFTVGSNPSAGRDAPRQFGNDTDAGPLTGLLLDPAQLADRLAPDASVVSYTDRLQGAAAKEVVAKLPAMTLDGRPREVRGTRWGYTIAQLSYEETGRKFPLRVSALMIAIPAATDGGWKVVALHYTD
jgi:hypothetical protein